MKLKQDFRQRPVKQRGLIKAILNYQPVQSLLGHNLGELGVSPGDVARHREVHGRRVEELHGHVRLSGFFLLTWLLLLAVLADDL
ncbi:hypothetical protein INR49_026302 [Caranx melampygus]|nr:hypothetical protein INR49_026302 [Caranx melampygus]